MQQRNYGRKQKNLRRTKSAPLDGISTSMYVLWFRLKLDPDQELPRMRDTLERIVATAKAEMLQNSEEDQEWEWNTRLTLGLYYNC